MEMNTSQTATVPQEKRHLLQRISHIGLLFVMVTASVLLLLMLIPRIFGYQVYVILTDSMKPTLPVGSLVFVKPVAFADVKERDICTFQSLVNPDKRFTHRIIALDTQEQLLYTKGDASANPDPDPTPYANMLGRVQGSVPFAGLPMLLIQKTAVQIAVGILLLLWVAVEIELAGGRRREKKQKDAAERMAKNTAEKVDLC